MTEPDPLTHVAEQWISRGGTSVLVLVLRRMPEGLVYLSTEVGADSWDLIASDILGPAIVDTLKAAEEGRVRRL